MAIIQLQIKTSRFCDLVRGEINSQPLDKPDYDEPSELKGKPVERIQCETCSFSEKTSGENKVELDAIFRFFYHQSLNEVRAAGSLVAATPASKDMRFRIRFGIEFPLPSKNPVLAYEVLAYGLVRVKKSSFPIVLPPDLNIVAGAVVANAQVLAIRLSDRAGEVVDAPPVDQTQEHDWIELIPADLPVGLVQRALDRALDAAVVPATPDPNKPRLPKAKPKELRKAGAATASWWPLGGPQIHAKGEIIAVDACPAFDVDISIELSLAVTLNFPNPGTLRTRAVLTWNADSTWCDVLATLSFTVIAGIAFHIGIEGEVSDTVLGKHLSPGDGFVEVSRTDDSITYERLASSPPAPSAEFKTTYAAVAFDGFRVGGIVTPKEGAHLVGEAVSAEAEFTFDCNLRGVGIEMNPAKVLLRTNKSRRLPRLFSEKTIFDPPGAWIIETDTEAYDPADPKPSHLVLSFADPPAGRLPVGTPTSVFLFTDFGVRWADLGVVPEMPDSVPDELYKLMNRYCDSITNPWAGGIVDLTWVDPLVDPDYEHQSLAERLRFWRLGLRSLPAEAHIEVIASNSAGEERLLGVIERQRDVALELVTEPDERLLLRVERRFEAPAPTISRSWFYPITHLDGRVVETFDRANAGLTCSDENDALMGRIVDGFAAHELRGRLGWAAAVQLRRGTHAIQHGNKVIVGTLTTPRRIQ